MVDVLSKAGWDEECENNGEVSVDERSRDEDAGDAGDTEDMAIEVELDVQAPDVRLADETDEPSVAAGDDTVRVEVPIEMKVGDDIEDKEAVDMPVDADVAGVGVWIDVLTVDSSDAGVDPNVAALADVSDGLDVTTDATDETEGLTDAVVMSTDALLVETP